MLLVFGIFYCFCVQAQEAKDTTTKNGRKAKFQIEVVPCDCDSTVNDSIALVNQACFDTIGRIVAIPCIFDLADSIADVFDVPRKLVYEIGMNESRWQNPYDLHYLIKDGDLQVIDRTFNHFYKELGLKGGKTRKNYLMVGIYYLRVNYDIYHNWEKARYAYGRGRWKPRSEWTALEKKFMSKINWSEYD